MPSRLNAGRGRVLPLRRTELQDAAVGDGRCRLASGDTPLRRWCRDAGRWQAPCGWHFLNGLSARLRRESQCLVKGRAVSGEGRRQFGRGAFGPGARR